MPPKMLHETPEQIEAAFTEDDQIEALEEHLEAEADKAGASEAKAIDDLEKHADATSGFIDNAGDAEEHFAENTIVPSEINPVRVTPQSAALVKRPELYNPVRMELAEHLHDADQFADFQRNYKTDPHPAQMWRDEKGLHFDNTKAAPTLRAAELRQKYGDTLRLAMRRPGAADSTPVPIQEAPVVAAPLARGAAGAAAMEPHETPTGASLLSPAADPYVPRTADKALTPLAAETSAAPTQPVVNTTGRKPPAKRHG